MSIRDSSTDGLVVIAIEGDIDHANVASLDQCLSAHLTAGKRRIVIDLQACSYIDSAGLSVILNLHRDVQRAGALALAAPNQNIRRIFELVGLIDGQGVQVHEDVAAACTAVSLD